MWWSETAQRHEVPTAILRNPSRRKAAKQLPYVKRRVCVPNAPLLPGFIDDLYHNLTVRCYAMNSIQANPIQKIQIGNKNPGTLEPRNIRTPEH